MWRFQIPMSTTLRGATRLSAVGKVMYSVCDKCGHEDCGVQMDGLFRCRRCYFSCPVQQAKPLDVVRIGRRFFVRARLKHRRLQHRHLASRAAVIRIRPSSTPRPRQGGTRVVAASGRDGSDGRDDGSGDDGGGGGGEPPPRRKSEHGARAEIRFTSSSSSRAPRVQRGRAQ